MKELEMKLVPFMGTELAAVKDESGQIWAGVRWMCSGIGLSENQTKNERRKIQTDEVLSKGGSNLALPTNGGSQEVLCLKLEYVPLWLAKISITPTMARKHPETADRLTTYQLKAKDVLAEAFLPKGDVLDLGQLSPIMQVLVRMEQRQKAQEYATQDLARRLALLESPADLTAIADAIQDATDALKAAMAEFRRTADSRALSNQAADPLWRTRCHGILFQVSRKAHISKDLLEEEMQRQASVRAQAAGCSRTDAYIEVVNELARQYGV